MELVFFLKPMVDMMYKLQILDYLLVFICLICLLKKCKMILNRMDIAILILMGLFAFSFLRNTNGLSQFFKIESGFLLYFIGRNYYCHVNKYIHIIRIGFIPVMLVTMITFVTGSGFQMWGNINTFSGLYFFKTDLAVAMAQCMLFYLFAKEQTINKRIIIFVCLFFSVLSNARAYYFIDSLIILIWFAFFLENRKNRKRFLKINLKLLVYILLIAIGVLLLLNYLAPLFGDQFLMFQFDSIADVYNDSNMQGRNLVWEDIYDKFSRKDFLTRCIGIDLCSDVSFLQYDSHNMYLKLLYSTGYIGVCFFLYYIICIVHYINRLKSRRLYYIMICLFVIYFFSGMSYITIQSTQLTWLPMFFLGACVTIVSNQKKIRRYIIGNTTKHYYSC